jgi:dihydropteroate synthase
MAVRPAPDATFLNPTGLEAGPASRAALAAGRSLPLAGGWATFSGVETVSGAAPDIAHLPLADAERAYPAALAALTAARPAFAGLALDRPRLMGIVNVTPDSFSDGGDYADPARAADRAFELAERGADIVDIGGESTRPGSAPTSPGEEADRVLPAIEAAAKGGILVSVDTRRPGVMRQAIAAGARIVNDIAALGEPGAVEAVARSEASVILMHMQGTPATMQAEPAYSLASRDVAAWLAARVAACTAAGIPKSRIAVDPGIGFGKTDAHNMEILGRFGLLHGLGCAVMAGVSRKSFIGRIARETDAKARLPGTIAATAMALARGVQLHRVHDVAEARQALAIWSALCDV